MDSQIPKNLELLMTANMMGAVVRDLVGDDNNLDFCNNEVDGLIHPEFDRL